MTIEAMKQALENELSASDFIDKAPQSWDKTERTEWARLQAMLHNIRVFKKTMRQAISEAEKQKPVVWMYQNKSTHEVHFQKHMRGFVDHGATYETPLYTTPQPQREWVGLMDEEIALVCAECAASAHNWNDISFARAIEAKLKDKNGGKT